MEISLQVENFPADQAHSYLNMWEQATFINLKSAWKFSCHMKNIRNRADRLLFWSHAASWKCSLLADELNTFWLASHGRKLKILISTVSQVQSIKKNNSNNNTLVKIKNPGPSVTRSHQTEAGGLTDGRAGERAGGRTGNTETECRPPWTLGSETGGTRQTHCPLASWPPSWALLLRRQHLPRQRWILPPPSSSSSPSFLFSVNHGD